jgi:hypothetical protein
MRPAIRQAAALDPMLVGDADDDSPVGDAGNESHFFWAVWLVYGFQDALKRANRQSRQSQQGDYPEEAT